MMKIRMKNQKSKHNNYYGHRFNSWKITEA